MDEEAFEFWEPRANEVVALPLSATYGNALETFPASFSHTTCRESINAATRAIAATLLLPENSSPEELENNQQSGPAAVSPFAPTSERPILSNALHETIVPTPEQQQQYSLGVMYRLSLSLLDYSNPGNFGEWPARVDGWPARVTKEAYKFETSSSEGQKVYARLALFAPARHYEGTEEPCIIVSLDPNETGDIKSCGDNRRGIAASFYRVGERVMIVSGPDHLPYYSYTSNNSNDILFVKTVLENIGRQILEKEGVREPF